jgi:hypothetical protein
MNDDERERLSAKLCQMWPRKFQDSELADWCARVDRYRIGDVLGALDEHRNTSKFKPQPSEILARLKGKEQGRDDADPGAREGSWADVRRRQNPQWAGRSDREVALRYWRSLWFRKKAMVDARLSSSDDKTRQRAQDELAGFKVYVSRGCVMTLTGEDGLTLQAAERCLPFVFEEDIGLARLMLADARGMNDQGEAVDVFAA